jgi:FkbM family methyltransferase
MRCKDGSYIDLSLEGCRVIFDTAVENFTLSLSCKDNVLILQGFLIPFQELLVSEDILIALRYGWKYDMLRKCWVKDNVRFKHMRYTILSVFERGIYRYVDAAGKTVIDIGAYIGATAIYFALKGARKVIAIEPHPKAFKEMLKNIKLNGLEDKVIPINAGLASKPEEICVENVNIKNTYRTYLKPVLISLCKDKVPAITLSEIIEKYGIKEAVLKMNCEGCEYDILLNEDPRAFMVFDQLFISYHHGYAELKKVLEMAGYKSVIIPIRGKPIEEQGFILAKRK